MTVLTSAGAPGTAEANVLFKKVTNAVSEPGSGGLNYIVTVDTGTLRLDVVDDDSIIDSDSLPLGGAGAGNGNFVAGQAYTVIDRATFVGIPTLDPRMLGALAVLLAAIAFVALRK